VGLSERLLVRRLRRGEREACTELIRRYHGDVYRYLRRLGADRALAEDITQETYAKAWCGIRSLRDAASLRSWLLAIARNEYFQWARSLSGQVATVADPPESLAGGPDPEGAALLGERDRRLREAVGQLEPDLREIVGLHYFQDLSLREAGAVLGIPKGTAKSRVHRALECLRSHLEPMEAEHEQERAGTAFADPP
jgi:RNA polymerase sigma-70 factor (ECF subfamily)